MTTTEECPILFQRKVNVNQVGASQKLHYHSRGDNGSDSEFHEGAPVGGEDDTHPVKRVRGVGGHDTIEGDLGADQEYEEGYGGP